jgi:hypothetical protein
MVKSWTLEKVYGEQTGVVAEDMTGKFKLGKSRWGSVPTPYFLSSPGSSKRHPNLDIKRNPTVMILNLSTHTALTLQSQI